MRKPRKELTPEQAEKVRKYYRDRYKNDVSFRKRASERASAARRKKILQSMTPEEAQKWLERTAQMAATRKENEEIFKQYGKEEGRKIANHRRYLRFKAKNPESVKYKPRKGPRKYISKYMEKYWEENPLKYAAHRMRCRLNDFKKRKFIRTSFNTGYTQEELNLHLIACRLRNGGLEGKLAMDHVIPIIFFFEFAGKKASNWVHIICALENLDYIPKSVNSSKFNLISDSALSTAAILEARHPQELTGFVDFLKEKQEEQKSQGRRSEVKL